MDGRHWQYSGTSRSGKSFYLASMSKLSVKTKAFKVAYPEKIEPRAGWFDRAGSTVAGPFLRWHKTARSRAGPS